MRVYIYKCGSGVLEQEEEWKGCCIARPTTPWFSLSTALTPSSFLMPQSPAISHITWRAQLFQLVNLSPFFAARTNWAKLHTRAFSLYQPTDGPASNGRRWNADKKIARVALGWQQNKAANHLAEWILVFYVLCLLFCQQLTPFV